MSTLKASNEAAEDNARTKIEHHAVLVSEARAEVEKLRILHTDALAAMAAEVTVHFLLCRFIALTALAPSRLPEAVKIRKLR